MIAEHDDKDSDHLRVLITGADGQVGRELQSSPPRAVTLLPLNRMALDITDGHATLEAIRRLRPDWIINAAAYTAVDKAEEDSAQAFAINRDGSVHLARAAAAINARMLQISTDYVFNGKQGCPYSPHDEPDPVNVYGESKLAGEIGAGRVLGKNLCILRTSWVYAAHGRNFLTAILRLLADEREIGVIEDQVGTPTCAAGLAGVIYAVVQSSLSGIYHWADAGVASWYDFAMEIQGQCRAIDATSARGRIIPVMAAEYPAAAKRPSYSVLDKSLIRAKLNLDPEYWRVGVRRALKKSRAVVDHGS